MEAFLGTQVHVLSGMGYEPTARGVGLYNQQMGMLMQGLAPDDQERMRVQGRDAWRDVLCAAFNIDRDEVERNELGVVEAREVMHRVSVRMREDDVLDEIEAKCGGKGEGGSDDAKAEDHTPEEAALLMQAKHTAVQEVLVHSVYLGGQPKSLVSELGFGEGERGYVFMQCVMAEHQADPMVAQYVGSAMQEVLKRAGLDPETIRKAAQL